MPMDRLPWTLGWIGLACVVISGSTGCRSTRSEVPPGRPFSSDGKTPQALNFGSSPNPSTAAMAPPISGAPGTINSYGTPPPGGGPYGATPTNTTPGAYVPPTAPPASSGNSLTPTTGSAMTTPTSGGISRTEPTPNRWSSTDPTATDPQPPTTSPFAN